MSPAPRAPKTLKPSSKSITTYYSTLRDLADQNVSHEQAVRAAFQELLAAAARPHKWVPIPELGQRVKANRIIPDGTCRDAYNLPRGHWEAKDSADNLDAEIAAKIKKGYPLDNTIFWTPDKAVLFQDGKRILVLDLADPQNLCDILNQFFAFTAKPILDFSEAVEEFTDRVPKLGERLAEIIADAHNTNPPFQKAFASFFSLCQTALNPNISQAAVDEMLIQHLLTERLFKTVFNNPEFVRKNVIAAEVEGVIDALASRHFTREEFLKGLDRFYFAIESAAAQLTDFSEKQHFLNNIYERFFQGYCVKTADTHGIVYTPQEIVDFMCASVEWVLKEEFGKALGDDGVEVLDPATGTGNFVVNLLRRAEARGRKPLERLYRQQIFANEIMLMPYYIAALNIEHAFYELHGDYEPFEGLCFVDTLELAEAKSQIGLFSEKNLERVQRQKRAEITVVIGNPPYNMGQVNENDNNKNRKYRVIDERVRVTYGKASKATLKTKIYDPYVKFFRWASDRLNDRDGIVCFVSNNSFVENVAFDGMRKHLARDFQKIYHLDLEGDVRQDPHKSGTQFNVFGIQVGVGITIAVRRRGSKAAGVRYATVGKEMRRHEKLGWLHKTQFADEVHWRKVRPDAASTWLQAAHGGQFASFLPVADKHARNGENGAAKTIFRDYSLGVSTNRDATVYDFSKDQLLHRMKQTCQFWNAELDRYRRAVKESKPKKEDIRTFIDQFADYAQLKWSYMLKGKLLRKQEARFDGKQVIECEYRPWVRRWLYTDPLFIDAPGGQLRAWGGEDFRQIAVSDIGWRSSTWSCLMADSPVDLHLAASADGHQCLPLYTSDEAGNRRENITDWALAQFRGHYQKPRITKWDIFHYVYAILHHPGYRERFADNLKRELPRIPFAPDFAAFKKAGERLADLHLHYDDEEAVKPFPLREVWDKSKPKSYRVEKMKLSKDKTSLKVNDLLTLDAIPPEVFTYRLGNRSALDWIIDQYQVYTDPRSNITSDPNAWGNERGDPEYIVRLVKQVVTVSLETVKIVSSLPAEFSSAMPTESSPETEPDPPSESVGTPSGTGKPFKLRADPPAQSRLRRST